MDAGQSVDDLRAAGAGVITGWGALLVDALIVWTIWLLIRARRFPRKTEEMNMAICAKMRLEGVYGQSWGGSKAIFRCDYDPSSPEDLRFQKATPTGMAEFQIDNPKASEQLVIGKSYYFDITPAD